MYRLGDIKKMDGGLFFIEEKKHGKIKFTCIT